jgi:hypothetical protein
MVSNILAVIITGGIKSTTSNTRNEKTAKKIVTQRELMGDFSVKSAHGNKKLD